MTGSCCGNFVVKIGMKAGFGSMCCFRKKTVGFHLACDDLQFFGPRLLNESFCEDAVLTGGLRPSGEF